MNEVPTNPSEAPVKPNSEAPVKPNEELNKPSEVSNNPTVVPTAVPSEGTSTGAAQSEGTSTGAVPSEGASAAAVPSEGTTSTGAAPSPGPAAGADSNASPSASPSAGPNASSTADPTSPSVGPSSGTLLDENITNIRNALKEKNPNNLISALSKIRADREYTAKYNQATKNFLAQLDVRLKSIKNIPIKDDEYLRDLNFIENEFKFPPRWPSEKVSLNEMQEREKLLLKEYERKVEEYRKKRQKLKKPTVPVPGVGPVTKG